jgi:hypothetical protein
VVHHVARRDTLRPDVQAVKPRRSVASSTNVGAGISAGKDPIPQSCSRIRLVFGMARGLRKDAMPENPSWIDFNRSDGHSDHWPTNTEGKLDDIEYIDSWRLVPVDEPGRSIKWRKEIAMSVAESMKLPSKVIDIIY